MSALAYSMLRIRMVEEAIAERYAQQEMRCPVHLSIGQEAVAVGVCQALLPTDYMVSNHRAHAHYLAKGGNLNRMIAEIYGKSSGCSKGRGGSMHLVDLDVGMLGSTPIVGGSIPVGVGAAFGSVLKGEKRVTVIFFGEGATEEGVFSESLNFAALKRLPVLFVCENNLYSVYSPLAVRQPAARSRVRIALSHGMSAQKGMGNDVNEVHRIASAAVQQVRAGNGPYFLEFDTYRFREHCGPNRDDDLGYRPLEEVAYWESQCPLKKCASHLTAEMRQMIQAEIEEAFERD
jgi:TPP-dependent pyruvate/acetoin dehydrogenase alpha subunit